MALVNVTDRIVPVADRRRALQRLAGEAGIRPRKIPRIEISSARADAGVVGADGAAHVIRIVLLALDVTDHVAARIHEAQQIADLAVQRPGRAVVAILAVSGRKGGQLVLAEGLAVRVERIAVEITLRLHVLVVLLWQRVPVVVDLPQRREARALVIDAVGVASHQWAVVGSRISSQVVRRRTGDVTDRVVDVVDVAAAAFLKICPAHCETVGDRQVEHCVQGGIRVSVSGEAVGGIDVARGGAQLRLVGDVANRARLSAAAVERALWTLEDFDALHVDQVGVVIACRELHRLVIEIQGHVRKWRRRRLRLVARADSPQPAHEDIAGARAVAAEGHVGRVLQQVVERHDVQLRELITGDRLDRDRYVL